MSAMLLTEPLLLVLKVTILLAMGGLLTLAARGAPAAVRHLVWAATLIGVLALPLLVYGLPRWSLPLLPTAPLPAEAPLAPPPLPMAPALDLAWEEGPAAEVAPLPSVEASRAAAPAAAGPARPRDLPHPLLLLWAAGTLAVLGWVVLGQLGVGRLRRGARQVRDPEWLNELHDACWMLEISRPVALLRGNETSSPMTWGLIWPAVLLPAEADAWSAERRRMVLLHELAHVQRKDCLTQLAAHLACAAFWFHPLVWYAARQLRVERERACDDIVVRTGAPAADYADHLLHVARSFRAPRAAGTAIAMARPSQLEGRLLAVLDARRRRDDPSLAARLAAVLAVGLLAVPLAALQPAAAGPATPGTDPLAGLLDAGTPADAHAAAEIVEVRGPESAAMAAALGSGQEVRQEYRWRGDMHRGQTLAVYTHNGPIRAVGVRGGGAQVLGVGRELRRDEREVRIETVRHAGGVAVCLLPEGATCTPDGIREPDRRGNRGGTRQVEITVEVPEGVSLRAESMNGALRLEEIASDVRALTMNGAINVSAAGVVHARTMNGGIVARMGRTDWSGELELQTMNGPIHVTLPASASTAVSASTMAGGIRSDFPLELSRRVGMPSARGTIGAGGRSMKLHTMNGSIRISREGGAERGASLHMPAAPPAPAAPPQPARPGRSTQVALDGNWTGFERSVEAIAESAADLGVGIAEGVVGALVSAFAGDAATSRRASPEVYIQRLRTDPDDEVRRVAAWGLARSPGSDGVRALTDALGRDACAEVREMAAWSLGTLRERAGARALRQALAGDADDDVRTTSLWALERIGIAEVLPALDALAGDRSPEVRQRAVWLIGDQRAAQGFDALVHALGDRDSSVRQTAAWSLGRLGDARAVPHLARALDDRSQDVRLAALWAATRVDDTAAAPLLEKASRDRDRDVRRQALGALSGEPWPWPWPWPQPMPRPVP
jgi:beta-lactamase regulating signal transducer with metallopeptidase domain